MKFLFASDFLCDWNSGSAGSILAIGDALSKRGHTIDYLWGGQRSQSFLPPSLERLLELPRRQYQQVRRQMEKVPYDVAVVSQPYSYLIYERLPKLYPRTVFLNRTHGWEERFNKARLKWSRNLNRMSMKWWLAILSTQWIGRICRRTARSCHGLIAPSHICADFVKKSYGVSEQKVAVIPYGLSEEFLKVADMTRSSSNRLKLLFVGNYIELKGIRLLESTLPAIAAEDSNLDITFVVPNEAVDRVKTKYSPSFGDRLTVLGWQKRNELISLYSEHHVLLFPTLFEGFGKVFMEAMACGMCVVGFGEGGLSDIARSGESALFCQAGDGPGFGQLLKRCLSTPQLTLKIGRSAQRAVREYTWERTVLKTEEFCTSLFKQVVG